MKSVENLAKMKR